MTIINIQQETPDPSTPPLAVTYGREDDGTITSTVVIGGQTVIGAVALLLKTACDLLHDTPLNSQGVKGCDIPTLDHLAHLIEEIAVKLRKLDELATRERL